MCIRDRVKTNFHRINLKALKNVSEPCTNWFTSFYDRFCLTYYDLAFFDGGGYSSILKIDNYRSRSERSRSFFDDYISGRIFARFSWCRNAAVFKQLKKFKRIDISENKGSLSFYLFEQLKRLS